MFVHSRASVAPPRLLTLDSLECLVACLAIRGEGVISETRLMLYTVLLYPDPVQYHNTGGILLLLMLWTTSRFIIRYMI